MGKAIKGVLKPVKRLGKTVASALGLEAPELPDPVAAPQPTEMTEQPKGEVNDGTSEALANARQQALKLASRRGRSSFRIDLAGTSSGTSRTGVNFHRG